MPESGLLTPQYIEFSGDQQGSRNRYYANRWRLEPKDKEAFLSGKLSEPQKPIVFYVDNTFPEKWQEYISRSVAQWNKAFEKIGYKDAIRTKIYPQKIQLSMTRFEIFLYSLCHFSVRRNQ